MHDAGGRPIISITRQGTTASGYLCRVHQQSCGMGGSPCNCMSWICVAFGVPCSLQPEEHRSVRRQSFVLTPSLSPVFFAQLGSLPG